MPTEVVENPIEEVVEDRRAVLEAAFEEAETSVTPVETKPEVAKPEEVKPVTPEVTQAPQSEEEAPQNVDKAPQSWRAGQKAKWAALDPDVRQEIVRRERDISRTLGETAQARQLANQFQQAVQPFMARIQSTGITPLQAVNELLKADHILSTSPAPMRAQYMAKLIKDYGVDIRALDDALAGTATADPVQATVEKLVEQRLAPFQQYIAQQQYAQQQYAAQQAQQTQMTVERMAQDPKFPHFQDVRHDMADVIDLAAKRGVYLSLEQAYQRAVAMNPEINQALVAQQAEDAKKAAAQTANARAQRALNASKSVGGAPVGAVSSVPVGTDRRAALEAAFSAVEGR
jgi:hypothetical protein